MSSNTLSHKTFDKRWIALGVCLTGTFLTLLDVSIINVALPTIQDKLHASPSSIQIILSGYTLAFGLALIPAGRLGDLFGRSRLFVIGLFMFGLTSLLAGLSTDATMLAIFRVIQGASAGILNPQITGLIQQLFDKNERPKAFSTIGMVVGVSTAIGPLLGGSILSFIHSDYSWRMVFWINVPFSIIAIIASFKVFPFSKPGSHKQKFDIRGTLLIAIVSIFFMIPFITESESSLFTTFNFIYFGIAIIALTCLYYWEKHYYRKHKTAVLDPRLIRNPSFRYGALLGAAYFAGFTTPLLLVTILLQNGLGCSPLVAGLWTTPFAIASGIGARFSSIFVVKYGRKVLIGGVGTCLFFIIISATLIFFAPPHLIPPLLSISLFFAGLGSGNVIAPNNTFSLQSIPIEIGSTAGGVMNLGQRIGQSVGMSISIAIYYGLLNGGYTIEFSTAIAFIFTISALLISLSVSIIDYKRHIDY